MAMFSSFAHREAAKIPINNVDDEDELEEWPPAEANMKLPSSLKSRSFSLQSASSVAVDQRDTRGLLGHRVFLNIRCSVHAPLYMHIDPMSLMWGREAVGISE
jgi:hypothetical protein